MPATCFRAHIPGSHPLFIEKVEYRDADPLSLPFAGQPAWATEGDNSTNLTYLKVGINMGLLGIGRSPTPPQASCFAF